MIVDVNLKLEKGFAVSEGPIVKGVKQLSSLYMYSASNIMAAHS